MEVEEEAESRKKFDEQRKRLQRQLRDVEMFTGLLQETQSGNQRKFATAATRV